MTALMNAIDGGRYLFRGARLVLLPGMRRYIIIPLLISTAVFAALFYFAVLQIESFAAWLINQLPAWLDWLSWLIWPVFLIAAILLVAYTFVAVTGLISAPFNALLAQRIACHLRGQSLPATEQVLWREIWTSLTAELRKLRYFALRALPLALLFFIPVVNVAAPFLWFLFAAWMLAREYLDIAFGLRGIPFHQQDSQLKANRGLVLGFGVMTAFIALIPLVNLLLIPSAVAGATALWLERIESNLNSKT